MTFEEVTIKYLTSALHIFSVVLYIHTSNKLFKKLSTVIIKTMNLEQLLNINISNSQQVTAGVSE